MLQLFGGADNIEASDRTDHFIGQESIDDCFVPTVRAGKQVAISLQVRSETADQLHEPFFFANVIADGRETRPHLYIVRIAASLFGGALDGLHAMSGGLVGEERMQHHFVEASTREFKGVIAECDHSHRQELIECCIEVEHWPGASRSVVANDDFAAKQSPHKPGEIFHLRSGDPANAECILHRGNTATKSQRESAAGEALHGAGKTCSDDRMPSVVIGCRSGDSNAFADGTDSAAKRGRFFLVVALADEHSTETQCLAFTDFGNEVAGGIGLAWECVEAKFRQNGGGHLLRHDHRRGRHGASLVLRRVFAVSEGLSVTVRAMRGIISWGAYLPYRRLDKSQISAFIGQGGGRGTRAVASFDEDTTSMGVEAARLALRGVDASKHSGPDALLFGTALPAYADKTNATAIHAALRLSSSIPAFDMGASVGSTAGALRLGLSTIGDRLIVMSDMRTGLAGSADEANGGDAAAAFVIGESDAVVAEYIGGASITEEFIDRWRTPGDIRSKVWDDKFSELTYVAAGRQAYKNALEAAGLSADQIDLVAVAAPTARIGSALASKVGAAKVVDDLTATIGCTGAAQPGLVLANALESAEPGQTIALVVLADGADVMILRTTPALAKYTPVRSIAKQLESGAPLAYGRFLSWRGMINVEPPRRPEPARPSGTAAARTTDWKFGFVGSRDSQTGDVFLPPMRVSSDGQRTDQMEDAPMADVQGTIATFTVDRMAYSPSPPIIFAVVDFDGGGRLPIELTDTDLEEVAIGGRVEMTFRRLFTADGIHNYFWKGKLIRG